MEDRKSILKALWNKRMLTCIFNGFVAGMPLYYLTHLLPAWFRTSGVDLKTIGLFSLVGIPYTYKFVWSPLMDRYVPPFLGRRRGWMLITQIALLLLLMSFSFQDPADSVALVACTAFAVAFFSASQDIVLDAYRRELLPDEELGMGNSCYVYGYRASVFIPGSLGLILAQHVSWSTTHLIVASFMVIAIIKTLLIKEAATSIQPPKNFKEAVTLPFVDFFKRDGIGSGLLLLAFLLFYKLGDSMATALSTPFYLDLGFDLEIIGATVKLINFWSIIIGAFIGGVVIYKIGINRSLWFFGVVQLTSILGFAFLSLQGPDVLYLSCVLAFEYIGVGLGTAALTAFMARSTNKNFTATQFALFSSLIALPRTFANSITGFLVEGISPADKEYFEIFGAMPGMGYTMFFVFCAASALPGMFLLLWVAPWSDQSKSKK